MEANSDNVTILNWWNGRESPQEIGKLKWIKTMITKSKSNWGIVRRATIYLLPLICEHWLIVQEHRLTIYKIESLKNPILAHKPFKSMKMNVTFSKCWFLLFPYYLLFKSLSVLIFPGPTTLAPPLHYMKLWKDCM